MCADYLCMCTAVHQLRYSHSQLANRIDEVLVVHDQIKGQLHFDRLASCEAVTVIINRNYFDGKFGFEIHVCN